MRCERPAVRATAAAMVGVSALHLAWAFGSPFPFRDRSTLADRVVGASEVPPPAACAAVSGSLLGAAALVTGARFVPPMLRRPGLVVVVAVLFARSMLGFAGRTDLVSPGSESSAFRRLDRRVYSPLCLALSSGAAVALRSSSTRR